MDCRFAVCALTLQQSTNELLCLLQYLHVLCRYSTKINQSVKRLSQKKILFYL